jgi:hypothetical protein
MSDVAILRELDQLERVQVDLATVATRTDDRRRHDLIDLRRKLAAQIAEVGRVADPFFGGAHDGEAARTYRAKFSAMRSAAALHQASWPAVRLGESPHEYQESALRVREANRDFVSWMRGAVANSRSDTA